MVVVVAGTWLTEGATSVLGPIVAVELETAEEEDEGEEADLGTPGLWITEGLPAADLSTPGLCVTEGLPVPAADLSTPGLWITEGLPVSDPVGQSCLSWLIFEQIAASKPHAVSEPKAR